MSQQRHILLTGAGAPGVEGTLYALRELGAFIIGVDADPHAVGQYLCDDFRTIPMARDEKAYLTAVLLLCAEFDVDVILPQNTSELLLLSAHKAIFEAQGTEIVVSDVRSIECANNKYQLLEESRRLGLPTCEYVLCTDFAHLRAEVERRKERGLWTVVKPPCGNGSRGVRVIVEGDASKRKEDFYRLKPSSLYCTTDELYGILGDEFPELLVMDYLEGEEFTVDVLRTEKSFVAIPRKRESMRSGITFRASLEQDETMIRASRELAEALDLRYCFGFQFKRSRDGLPMLLECNPRVQGTMVMSVMAGANIIAAAVRAALGEEEPEMAVRWDTKLVRYWGAIGVNESGMVKI